MTETLIQSHLEYLADMADHLTDWERSFVESVSDEFTQRGSLTTKQQGMLERIYERY